MRLSVQCLQHEYVLPAHFAVLDAALREHLRLASEFGDPHKFRRTRLTEGSVQYFIYREDDAGTWHLAHFGLRMSSADQTYISVTLRPLPPDAPPQEREYLEGWCKLQLIYFVNAFWGDQKRMKELAAGSPTPDNTAVVSAELGILAPAAIQSIPRDVGGRPRQSDDDWAWEQIHIHHRPHREVKKEWRQRNKENGRILKEENQAWSRATKSNRMKKLGD
jgi:hypothetical protein